MQSSVQDYLFYISAGYHDICLHENIPHCPCPGRGHSQTRNAMYFHCRRLRGFDFPAGGRPFRRDEHQKPFLRKFNRDVKAIRTLGTLMGLFCFCWLPFFLMYLILPFCRDCYLPPEAASAITWLGYANSLINPMVYAFLNRDFRTAFKKLLTCRR